MNVRSGAAGSSSPSGVNRRSRDQRGRAREVNVAPVSCLPVQNANRRRDITLSPSWLLASHARSPTLTGRCDRRPSSPSPTTLAEFTRPRIAPRSARPSPTTWRKPTMSRVDAVPPRPSEATQPICARCSSTSPTSASRRSCRSIQCSSRRSSLPRPARGCRARIVGRRAPQRPSPGASLRSPRPTNCRASPIPRRTSGFVKQPPAPDARSTEQPRPTPRMRSNLTTSSA